jgi:XapX domain-containing protein
MSGYIISLAMGLIFGAAYALIQVRSPAPPLIALFGLLGMVIGEQAMDMAKRHFQPPPPSIGQRAGVVQAGR